jgi:hypothetical protein
MNRVGRLLICIAGGVALSVTAYGDIAPAPPVAPNVNALRQNTNLMNRILLMKKRHQSQNAQQPQNGQPGFSQFAKPFLPKPGGPRVVVSHTHGNTAVADNPGTTATAATASSSNPGNPYDSIVTRNVFGLNPIPPYHPPDPPQGPPPPKINLTGITTIFGPAQALFKVAGVMRNGKAQDESYIFTEGQEEDEVTVKTIDVKKQIVTFMNHGVEQTIPLTDGVASSGGSSSAPSWPGQNGPRTFRRFPRFGGAPGVQPQTFGGGQPQSYNNSYNNQSGNGFGNNQSGQNNSPYNPSAQAINAGMSGEDEAALIAAQHAQYQQQGNPMSAIMPPTSFDKDAGLGPEPGATPEQTDPSARR